MDWKEEKTLAGRIFLTRQLGHGALKVRVYYPGHIGVCWALHESGGNAVLTEGILYVESLKQARIPALRAAANWLREQSLMAIGAIVLTDAEGSKDGAIGSSRGVSQSDSKNAGPETEETGLERRDPGSTP